MDAISGFVADCLWLIDINAGGFRQKKRAKEFYTQLSCAVGLPPCSALLIVSWSGFLSGDFGISAEKS